jgi:hypothetical protein
MRLCETAAVIVITVCLSFTANRAQAQVDETSITGIIKDPSGATVEGARVEAISKQNGKQREVSSNSAGVYTIPNLPLGTYTVSVEKAGFANLRFDSVECRVGSVVTLNATLRWRRHALPLTSYRQSLR